MMIAVTGEFEQHESADDMIAVPAMRWSGTFITVCTCFLALQSVVLDVVDGFQEKKSDDGGTNKP